MFESTSQKNTPDGTQLNSHSDASVNPTENAVGTPPMQPLGESVPSAPAQPIETAVEQAMEAKTGLDALEHTPQFDPTKSSLDPAEIDRLTSDMFKRAGLSSGQKWALFFGIGAVIALFLGGGVALYLYLDPFSDYQPESAVNSDGIISGDTDGDGISDVDEIRRGTDSQKADTDGDGLDDGDELNVFQTNALEQDTDGDGYLDGDEVLNGYDPNGPGRL